MRLPFLSVNRRVGYNERKVREGSAEGDIVPMHDWTRVSDGTFHDFHYSWVLEIKRALKRGLLPEGYYVMAEQFGGDLGDVAARLGEDRGGEGPGPGPGPIRVTVASPLGPRSVSE